MDRLWSPWRHEYIATAGSNMSDAERCIFCEAHNHPADDEKNFVLHRGAHNFVILNLYPYISGHLMIAPNAHLGEFDSAGKETTDEMMDLAKRCQAALREVYRPQGFNIGMNLGRAAGAGVAHHFHMHIMPRWEGDTNFMSTVGETRVLPEDLPTTYQKLLTKF
ncbi:MAG TPA: HIT domain-containing protein [Pyrinomonadaceae bacterium]|nr:HIT domain-containing protein [Pyrinomonadaceae bacterium]